MPSIRNFIILTALKIQQLMGEIREAKELHQKMAQEHLRMKEIELS